MGFRTLIAGIALAAAAIAVPTTASAVRAVINCRTTDMKIVTSDQVNSTSNGSFVQIPDMTGSFVQGTQGCIVVELQAAAFAALSGNGLLSLDARLDNDDSDNYLGPGQPQYAASDGMWNKSRTIKFIWSDVGPGTHNVRLFYRSANGGQVILSLPFMIINYHR